MAPARTETEDDDPVTAEYDIFLTPALEEKIYLLQYPNRNRERPYNTRFGGSPNDVRIKPQTGYLELDIPMNTAYNFNKLQSLKWGDAMQTAQEVQNSTGTYGLASGFGAIKPRSSGRIQLKDSLDRYQEWQQDLAAGFHGAEAENRVMKKQTLGGQIVHHDSEDENGKPLYFVGAFKENQLHLTKVDGTAQLRPQFHHVDAEEQRARLAASRAAALESEARPRQGDPRGLAIRQSKNFDELSEKDKLEARMKKALQDAEAESWVKLDYVDEDLEDAYEKFRERMFVRDVEGAAKLQSTMGEMEFLDAISAPRRESPTRRRKRAPRRKSGAADAEGEQDGDGGA